MMISVSGKKTLWEKEKMLVTSIFSFYHSIFKSLTLNGHKNQGLFGKGLKKKPGEVSIAIFKQFIGFKF